MGGIHLKMVKLFSIFVVLTLGVRPGLFSTAAPAQARDAQSLPAVQSTPSEGENMPAALGAISPPTWEIECVECPKEFASFDRSLQLDADLHPHIAYGGNHLYYAWQDGTSWHYETVDSAYQVGRSASLALDSNGDAHIAYFDLPNGKLKYAHRLNGAWQIETVDRAVEGSATLILDSAGGAHIAYSSNDQASPPAGPTTYSVKYASRTGSSWDIQTLEQGTSNSNSVVGGVSLALDSSNRPHISYALNYLSNDCYYCLKYAVWNGSDWDFQYVEKSAQTSVPISIGGPQLILDPAGAPHILYYHMVDGHPPYTYYLLYASLVGDGWDVQTIVSGHIGTSSIALEAVTGIPHIVYQGESSLIHTYWNGSAWIAQTVDEESASDITLVLENDLPHIAYYMSNSLKYARFTGSSWDIQVVDTQRSVGQYNSIAIDSSGNAHISYLDDTDHVLKYAYWTGSAWIIEPIDPTAYSNKYSSITLDTGDHPHISYFTLKDGIAYVTYAQQLGSSWDIQTVDSGLASDAASTSLALDGNGGPHIAYRYDRVLKYALWTGSTWEVQTVLSQNNNSGGSGPSLALDSAGNPHLTYQEYESDVLKYARWNGNDWVIQTVDSDGVVGQYSSLALDSSNRPHISYLAAYPNWDLRYASWTGTAWEIQTVDSAGYAGFNTSLALDKAGNPHISYLQSRDYLWPSPQILKYAVRTGGHWNVQKVTGEKNSNVYGADLALSPNGLAQVSYYDPPGLKIARLFPTLTLDKQAKPDISLQAGDILTYTVSFSAPYLNARLVDPLPDEVDYITGTLSTSIAPSAVYSPTTRTIVWQGTLTDTLQTIQFQVSVKGSYGGDSARPPAIINNARLYDDDHQRSLSSFAIANGWRAYYPMIVQNYP